jgi:hypothetical protein
VITVGETFTRILQRLQRLLELRLKVALPRRLDPTLLGVMSFAAAFRLGSLFPLVCTALVVPNPAPHCPPSLGSSSHRQEGSSFRESKLQVVLSFLLNSIRVSFEDGDDLAPRFFVILEKMRVARSLTSRVRGCAAARQCFTLNASAARTTPFFVRHRLRRSEKR